MTSQDADLTAEFALRVRAAAGGRPLTLVAGASKSFLGRDTSDLDAERLDLAAHRGILNHRPEELVITARAGTSLDDLEAALAECGQQLPFEPPRFVPAGVPASATLGGTIACGLSGPARPYLGSARDLVLGARILTGRGEVLRFGGEVMKNVAGYDISRLMVGAMGTLGVLLDLSLKVLPIPKVTHTRWRECSEAEALDLMQGWATRPLPITATCWDGARLWVRLAGAEQGVSAAAAQVGGEPLEAGEAADLWSAKVRDQRHGFFSGDLALWRLSLPAGRPPLDLPGKQFIEWGGAQRWLRSEAPAATIRAAAVQSGGHATLFRARDRTGAVFHPLPGPLMELHRRLKSAFDPAGILNPGRLYPGL